MRVVGVNRNFTPRCCAGKAAGVTRTDPDAGPIAEEAIDAYLVALVAGRDCAWPAEVDVATMLDRIDYHGIAALLLDRNHASAHWPEEAKAALRAQAHLQALWESSHADAVARLIEALAAAHVDSVALKGTALAYSVYPDPSQRRRGDTDLLIRRANVRQARDMLRAAGWMPSGERSLMQEGWLLNSGDGFVHALDLHWGIAGSPAMQRVLDPDRAFTRAGSLPRLSSFAQAPDPVFLFLHCCANRAQHRRIGYYAGAQRVHSPFRLIWCHDVTMQVSRFDEADWSELVRDAASSGLAGHVLDDLEMARATYGTDIPEPLREELFAAPLEAETERFLGETATGARLAGELRAVNGMTERMRVLWRHLFPPAKHMRQRFPDAARWLLPALYLRRMVAMSWQTLRPGGRA